MAKKKVYSSFVAATGAIALLLAVVPMCQRPEGAKTDWQKESASPSMENPDTAGASYYTCPMHPQVRLGEAGKCPLCGMKLHLRKPVPAR